MTMREGHNRLRDMPEIVRLFITAFVSLASLAGATYLAVVGRLEGEAVVALYGSVLSLWGASVYQHATAVRSNGNGG